MHLCIHEHTHKNVQNRDPEGFSMQNTEPGPAGTTQAGKIERSKLFVAHRRGAPAVPLPSYLSQQMSLTHAAYRCKEGRTEKIMDRSDFKSLGDTENTEGLIRHSSVWLHKKHTDRS